MDCRRCPHMTREPRGPWSDIVCDLTGAQVCREDAPRDLTGCPLRLQTSSAQHRQIAMTVLLTAAQRPGKLAALLQSYPPAESEQLLTLFCGTVVERGLRAAAYA